MGVEEKGGKVMDTSYIPTQYWLRETYVNWFQKNHTSA